MGMDFTEYLNNYRLIMAAKLLKSSDESVLMLAGSVVLTACLILIVFLKENKNLCPRFNVCIKRIFKEMQERVNQGDTICDLGIDYEEEFKNILKLKANSKTN